MFDLFLLLLILNCFVLSGTMAKGRRIVFQFVFVYNVFLIYVLSPTGGRRYAFELPENQRKCFCFVGDRPNIKDRYPVSWQHFVRENKDNRIIFFME